MYTLVPTQFYLFVVVVVIVVNTIPLENPAVAKLIPGS